MPSPEWWSWRPLALNGPTESIRAIEIVLVLVLVLVLENSVAAGELHNGLLVGRATARRSVASERRARSDAPYHAQQKDDLCCGLGYCGFEDEDDDDSKVG